jgi:hypothetical protein
MKQDSLAKLCHRHNVDASDSLSEPMKNAPGTVRDALGACHRPHIATHEALVRRRTPHVPNLMLIGSLGL